MTCGGDESSRRTTSANNRKATWGEEMRTDHLHLRHGSSEVLDGVTTKTTRGKSASYT